MSKPKTTRGRQLMNLLGPDPCAETAATLQRFEQLVARDKTQDQSDDVMLQPPGPTGMEPAAYLPAVMMEPQNLGGATAAVTQVVKGAAFHQAQITLLRALWEYNLLVDVGGTVLHLDAAAGRINHYTITSRDEDGYHAVDETGTKHVFGA